MNWTTFLRQLNNSKMSNKDNNPNLMQFYKPSSPFQYGISILPKIKDK